MPEERHARSFLAAGREQSRREGRLGRGDIETVRVGGTGHPAGIRAVQFRIVQPVGRSHGVGSPRRLLLEEEAVTEGVLHAVVVEVLVDRAEQRGVLFDQCLHHRFLVQAVHVARDGRGLQGQATGRGKLGDVLHGLGLGCGFVGPGHDLRQFRIERREVVGNVLVPLNFFGLAVEVRLDQAWRQGRGHGQCCGQLAGQFVERIQAHVSGQVEGTDTGQQAGVALRGVGLFGHEHRSCQQAAAGGSRAAQQPCQHADVVRLRHAEVGQFLRGRDWWFGQECLRLVLGNQWRGPKHEGLCGDFTAIAGVVPCGPPAFLGRGLLGLVLLEAERRIPGSGHATEDHRQCRGHFRLPLHQRVVVGFLPREGEVLHADPAWFAQSAARAARVGNQGAAGGVDLVDFLFGGLALHQCLVGRYGHGQQAGLGHFRDFVVVGLLVDERGAEVDEVATDNAVAQHRGLGGPHAELVTQGFQHGVAVVLAVVVLRHHAVDDGIEAQVLRHREVRELVLHDSQHVVVRVADAELVGLLQPQLEVEAVA